MSTIPPVQQRFICPNCRAAFNEASKFCGDCGSRMVASPLEAARTAVMKPDDGTRATGARRAVTADRRMSDSNRAWLGKIIDGRYRVLEAIGRGGVGVIYKVEHMRMGKVAAMKVLHRDLLADPEMAQRFEREATAVSKLHHPHTVQVFDFGTTDGSTYLIMEYVRGLDLAFVIERDGPMHIGRAAPLLVQICGALSEAHELGIVHRDLKPENVLVTRTTGGRDFAKVLDFGLAKLEQPSTPTMLATTDRATIVGTPYFMSPEQIRGDEVDARADVYSFGAMMFNLLTGEQLFTASSAVGVLTKHLTEQPDLPSARKPALHIDSRVDEIVMRCLYKEAERRWASIAQVSAALEALIVELGPAGRDPRRESSSGGISLPRAAVEDSESDLRLHRSDLDDFERSLKRRRFVIAGTMAAVVLGAIGAAAYGLTRPTPPVTEERESNDELNTANPIASGHAVTGYIGKRRNRNEGDRDVYRLLGGAERERVITAELTGLPNVNLALSVVGADGKTTVFADETGVGFGEVLYRRRVRGAVYFAVDQTRDGNAAVPQENVSDTYRLTVTEEAANASGLESEPNGTDADANAITVGAPVAGHLEARNDVDLLRWTGAAARVSITVQSELKTLRWQIGAGEWRTAGVVDVQINAGDIIRIDRTDRDALSSDATSATTPWTVRVDEKR